uniref:Uncharacterized protein n=1 Tax=Anguilla anguilla TaxID=7936 RepID=A0A0E9USY3_ANGAN
MAEILISVVLSSKQQKIL